MIRAIALDDEPLSLDLIENFCLKTDEVELVKKFTNPNEALKYLRKFPVDLIFLDINMPNVSGIEVLKQIKQNTETIFITAHSEYAVESYNLNALDYLLKPFEYDRFLLAIKKVKSKISIENSEEKAIFIRSDYRLIKIYLSEIQHIESQADYLTIVHKNQNKTITRMTMIEILELLKTSNFIRVHRSFIVPLSEIKVIRDKKIILDSIEIPIGISYEKEINQIFLK
ncbi:LytTR family DNA-binding domain-containing protein [Flavobacterium sp.]|uniref:LytR/AlgR family response regulator transcription factor n=1 Tax=Flavobacterium sp. TaxID=239 RepID=UPI0024895641|nr:LytTR family DNA-binding domain-containing protein [Flavobacterium sp.]MDI1316127.1 LytTR family DNA-binding domain-containing protein [Flavobacterium sp.]